MRKIAVVSLVVVLVLLAGSSGAAYGAGGLPANGNAGIGEETAGPELAALTCQIRNSAGVITNTVRRSSPAGIWGVRGYWVEWFGGPPWRDATVTLIINNPGLPEERIVQHFAVPAPGLMAGGMRTPFAIQHVGGAAVNGTGLLIVDTSNGVNTTLCTLAFRTAPF